MNFLKNHYEKILLCVVLVGLLGAAGWLLVKVTQVKKNVQKTVEVNSSLAHKPVGLRSFADYERALTTATNPPPVDLTSPHRLFNPLRWVRQENGELIKVRKGVLGIEAVVVNKIQPRYFKISFEGITGSDERPRYKIGTLREDDPDPRARRVKNHFLSVEGKTRDFSYGNTNVVLTLKEIQGEPTDPTAFTFEMTGRFEPITITKDQPYEEVSSYVVDLAYPPENQTFADQTVGAVVTVDREAYKIIEINQELVIFEALSNLKRITLRPNSGP